MCHSSFLCQVEFLETRGESRDLERSLCSRLMITFSGVLSRNGDPRLLPTEKIGFGMFFVPTSLETRGESRDLERSLCSRLMITFSGVLSRNGDPRLLLTDNCGFLMLFATVT